MPTTPTPGDGARGGDPERRSSLSRFFQPHEGGADIFGSERSFAPRVGDKFDLDARDPGGYYIDFRVKLDRPRWPPPWLTPRDEQLHVGTVQWALGAYERYLHGEGEEWLEAALAGARHLVSIQEAGGASDGAWLHWFPMPHTYLLPIPWTSGITQGEAVSLLARLHLATGDEQLGEAALRALHPLQTPVSHGGLMAELGDGPFFEEYPSRPASHVLNGAIFALWGIRDAGRALRDSGAAALFESGAANLAANIGRYDTGRWSRYDLYPHPVTNLATGSYHLLHINQLAVLERMRPDPELERVRERFSSYRARGTDRTRALAQKIAFRVAVPRNSTFAYRNPSMLGQRRRQAQGASLALCYHAVSEDWPAILAVKPSELERQVEELLGRGFEPVTFTELVHGEARGRRLAITFDDGFRSVAANALPILEQLGVPATMFIPTILVPGDEPLSWPGIQRWLDGPHRAELEPLSPQDLRDLGAAGWEIGSHSRSHPRLTELDDDALAEELRGSREECERLLGAPCLSLAYPYGDTDARVQRAAAEAGYACAAALPAGQVEHSNFAWPRIGVYRVDSMRRFDLKTAAAFGLLRRTSLWNLRRPHGAGGPES